MPYAISEQAKVDMLHLYVDGANKHGIDRAENYYAGLILQFETLAFNPKLYHERTDIKPPVRICPYGVHVIIYSTNIYSTNEHSDLTIVRIRHEREDWL